MIRRSQAPGVHGKKMTRSLSEYGNQLAVKQKIKRAYGVLERQFRKHFEQVKGKNGITGDLLLARLEMRLDSVVYRMGFGSSRSQSRQIVSHGLISVNGKKVTIPSYEVKAGDIVSIKSGKESKKHFKNIEQSLKNKKDFPSWISFDSSRMEGKIAGTPERSEVGLSADPQVVVEYYSR